MTGYYHVSQQAGQPAEKGSHSVGRGQGQGMQGYPQLSRKFVARRISEGETGRLKEELKCQACGKGYKHVSSLAKHLWEHTPEWNVTSKLLISKHQQVQLLEAASILVSMNEESDEEQDDGDSAVEADTPSGSESATPGPPSHHSITAKTTPPPVLNTPVGTPSDKLTPARDIPILSARPIAKTPRGHGHRRMSTATAGSVSGALGASLGASLGARGGLDSLAQQASPLPETLLGKDHAHNPPNRRRRQSHSFASSIPSSVPRDSGIGMDEDGLQDPHDAPDLPEGHESPVKGSYYKDVHGGVFGDLEV